MFQTILSNELGEENPEDSRLERVLHRAYMQTDDFSKVKAHGPDHATAQHLSFLHDFVRYISDCSRPSCSDNQLTSLAEALPFAQLEVLNLSRNSISSLGTVLQSLKLLRRLSCGSNPLTSLDLRCLQDLIDLSAEDCKLLAAPQNLDSCRNLKMLRLAGNQMKDYPDFQVYLLQTQIVHQERWTGWRLWSHLQSPYITEFTWAYKCMSEVFQRWCIVCTFQAWTASLILLVRVTLCLSLSDSNLPLVIWYLYYHIKLKSGNNLWLLLEMVPYCSVNWWEAPALRFSRCFRSGGHLRFCERIYQNSPQSLITSILIIDPFGPLLSYNSRGLGVQALSSLTELNLAQNQLKGSVPSTLGRLFGLSVLNLRHNRIISLPDAISQLTGLSELLLGHNNLQKLSESLWGLSGLKHLDLQDNRISELSSAVSG